MQLCEAEAVSVFFFSYSFLKKICFFGFSFASWGGRTAHLCTLIHIGVLQYGEPSSLGRAPLGTPLWSDHDRGKLDTAGGEYSTASLQLWDLQREHALQHAAAGVLPGRSAQSFDSQTHKHTRWVYCKCERTAATPGPRLMKSDGRGGWQWEGWHGESITPAHSSIWHVDPLMGTRIWYWWILLHLMGGRHGSRLWSDSKSQSAARKVPECLGYIMSFFHILGEWNNQSEPAQELFFHVIALFVHTAAQSAEAEQENWREFWLKWWHTERNHKKAGSN